MFARTGIEPSAGAETNFQLPDKLAAGTYWWRSKADDGANSSQYSAAKSFQVLADVILAPGAARAMTQTTERVVAIGTSTGGTQALEAVLTALPRVSLNGDYQLSTSDWNPSSGRSTPDPQ